VGTKVFGVTSGANLGSGRNFGLQRRQLRRQAFYLRGQTGALAGRRGMGGGQGESPRGRGGGGGTFVFVVFFFSAVETLVRIHIHSIHSIYSIYTI
jgi:hypothetical protein